MQGEEPVLGRDWPAGHGDPTVAGGRGAPGVGAHVVPGRQSWEKTPVGCLWGDGRPASSSAGGRWRGGPGLTGDSAPTAAGLRGPQPTPPAGPGSRAGRAPRGPPRRGAVAPGHPPPTLARARPGTTGVERGAEGLAHGGRQRGQWPRALDARGAEAMAEMRPRLARAHPLGGLSKPSGTMPRPRSAGSSKRGARERLRRLGQGGRTGLLGRAQRPAHPAADNCRQVHCVGETTAGLFSGQERGRGRLHRVRTDTRRGCPSAPTRRESAIGALEPSTAHRSKRRPPWVAKRALRATSGRLER